MDKIDNNLLSRYLDGELELSQAFLLSERIDDNPELQKKMLALLKGHVLLKSYGAAVTDEPVPVNMLKKVHKKRARGLKYFLFTPQVRAAVMVFMFLGGILFGRWGDRDSSSDVTLFPELPASLAMTINKVLEFEKSGTVHSWNSNALNASAKIIPVKTYKDTSGKYFRFYVVDLLQDGEMRKFKAIAHRVDSAGWKTDSFSSYIYGKKRTVNRNS